MKKLFLTLFLPLFLVAYKWDYTHDFILKKDEVAVIKVRKKADSSSRILQLRWTLYTNERLVLLVNYDGFPRQYILQKEYKRNSIRITLRDDYSLRAKRSYLILTFKDFSDNNRTALIKAFVADPNKKIEIGFIDPKKSKG